MNTPTETRTENSKFVVRVRNLQTNKQELHYFDTKAQSESFKSACKPYQYNNPAIYPIALHDKLSK